MTWVTLTLVDVDLTTRTSEAFGAVTPERSWCVDTGTIMLARKALLTLVDVLGTVDALVTRRTSADVTTVDG